MDILYHTAPPAYRGCSPQPQQQRSGFLGNLGCYLFGGGVAPSYRTKNGKNGGNAGPVVSRCWWQVFPATPRYQAAPVEPSHDDVPDEPIGSSDGGDCGCPAEDEPAPHVPGAIHVWTE